MTILNVLVWCALIVLGTLNEGHAATLRLYIESVYNFIETPLDDPSGLYPHINKTMNTTIYSAGFQQNATNLAITTMISTYLSLGNTNVMLLNWEKESQGILTSFIEYGTALIAAKKVASVAAKAFIKLFENGVSANMLHLVGHSLGAHLMGWAAEKVQSYKYNVSRICALDPAGPAFGKHIGVSGLKPSQASFVYVIHTNSGQYGTSESCGTVDFWVNCDYNGLQPGCTNGTYKTSDEQTSCSHNRPWRILSEALLNPGSFPAASAKSCSDWKSQNSSNVVINYFGDDVDPSKPGNFYFSTYAESPYSKGLNGLRPNQLF